MQGYADESVGERFSEDLLQVARDKTLQIIVNAAARIEPGMAETDAKLIIETIQKELGASRNWHPPQIRFGKNTLLPFGIPGDDSVRLQENDIYFFDIGPVFADHEGDVGRPFYLGSDPLLQKCCEDAKKLWHQVRNHWLEKKCTGSELYAFAEKSAAAMGWELSLKKANGHRIADFPHAARQRGSVEGFNGAPSPNRWILEIQIRHPERSFGAFYEDLLN